MADLYNKHTIENIEFLPESFFIQRHDKLILAKISAASHKCRIEMKWKTRIAQRIFVKSNIFFMIRFVFFYICFMALKFNGFYCLRHFSRCFFSYFNPILTNVKKEKERKKEREYNRIDRFWNWNISMTCLGVDSPRWPWSFHRHSQQQQSWL